MTSDMKRLIYLFTILGFLTACNYDETIDLCDVTVQLVYPENSINPYEGARVELKDASASIYVGATDANGMVRFQVPAGIYEASSANSYLDKSTDTWWQYNFNGVLSQQLVSNTQENSIQLELKMSRKRIVH